MKAGFARVDMTPPLGTDLHGYFHHRYAEKIVTPLYINAIAVDDGETKAALVTLDLQGMVRTNSDIVRKYASEKTGIDESAIFINCTHIHQGPVIGDFRYDEQCNGYDKMLIAKIADAIKLAIDDMKEAKTYIARGKAEGISFVRIYRMKDGSTKTNPGPNPDVVGPLFEPDETLQLLKFVREGAPDIAAVHFQTHPDVIMGDKSLERAICYDWPGYVRDYLEKALDDVADGQGVHVVCFNGTQGDSNHVNRLDRKGGVKHAKHMAKVIAGEIMKLYTYPEEVDCNGISFKQIPVPIVVRKGTEEELKISEEVVRVFNEGGSKAVKEAGLPFDIATARRFQRLVEWPKHANLYVSAVKLGEIIFVGFPGEPFTEIGRQTKAGSPFRMTFTCCLTNGSEGYFPMKEIYQSGGYEANAARFEEGTAERLIEYAVALTKELKD